MSFLGSDTVYLQGLAEVSEAQPPVFNNKPNVQCSSSEDISGFSKCWIPHTRCSDRAESQSKQARTGADMRALRRSSKAVSQSSDQ